MNPACQLCQGACCEGVLIPLFWFKSGDFKTWLSYHGTREDDDKLYLACPCRHRTSQGACAIYETRPLVCRTFGVGSKQCRECVKRLRPHQAKDICALMTSEQAAAILKTEGE